MLDPFRTGGVRPVVVGLELAALGGQVRRVLVDGRHSTHPEDEEEGDGGSQETRLHGPILHEKKSQYRRRSRRVPLLLPSGGTRLPLEKEVP